MPQILVEYRCQYCYQIELLKSELRCRMLSTKRIRDRFKRNYKAGNISKI